MRPEQSGHRQRAKWITAQAGRLRSPIPQERGWITKLLRGGDRMEIAYIVCMAIVAVVAILANRDTKK
jgi:hypothetical protein